MFLDCEWLPKAPTHLLKTGTIITYDDIFAHPVFEIQPPELHEINGAGVLFEEFGLPKDSRDSALNFLQTAPREKLDKINALNEVVPVLQHLEERAHLDQELRFDALDKVDGNEAMLPRGVDKAVVAEVQFEFIVNQAMF